MNAFKLIIDKFIKQFPKLNFNRIKNFENRFNSLLNYIIQSNLPPITINKTYNILISSKNNFTKIKPQDPISQLFELPIITITRRTAVKLNEVCFRYLLTSELIYILVGVEDFFDILNFTIRNEVRRYFENALMITARIRCTVEDNDGRRHDRFIEAGVHFCILNIDEINTLGDKSFPAFTRALLLFNHLDQLSKIIILDISKVNLNMTDYAAPAANGYILLSREINLTYLIINPNNDKNNYCLYSVILANFYIISDLNYKDHQRTSKFISISSTLISNYKLNFLGMN